MKIIGLVGGTSWVSTIDYYRAINEGINKQLGGNEAAECIIYSVNYGDIVRNNSKGDLEATFGIMLNASTHLKNSGAKAIILCANTMHMFADRISEKVNLPVIHTAEACANEIKKKGLKKVALLGTKFTMEMNFFKDKLKAHHIETIIPDDTDRAFIHQTIFDELGKNIVKAETKAKYLAIIDRLVALGAEGVILGCTEIPLLLKQSDSKYPLFDTAIIHSNAAVEFMLS
ncbi:MAG TPA: aspartate/glutamate racemase family protein [Bacteroidia bacterium]|jgi:aspartate racemase|nr:aspartate/glutamate racemase family protein [Bacteroidia bacterium]